MVDRNQVQREATELGAMLAKYEEVIAYREAEAVLWKHPRAAELMNTLRAIGESDDRDLVDEALDQVMQEWRAIPEAEAFLTAQEKVQALLETVSQIIAQSMMEHAGLKKEPADV